MFLAEVVAEGAVPTISEGRRLRFSQRGDKSLNQRQAAGLAAGIATDVGHAAVRAVFQELLAQTGRIETVPLVRRRRRRRRSEHLAVVRTSMLLAVHVHIRLIRRQWREVSGAASGREDDRQVRRVRNAGQIAYGKALIPGIRRAVSGVDQEAHAFVQQLANLPMIRWWGGRRATGIRIITKA